MLQTNNNPTVKKSTHLANLIMGKNIPKIIHQTYPNKLHLPIEIQDNIKLIKKLNTNWEYRLYDDADIEAYIRKNYGQEIFQVYCKIDPSYGAARADLFRYLLMYAEGGIYLDIKSSLTRPLNEVISSNDQYILSHWENQPGERHDGWGMRHQELKCFKQGEYQQWHIIAVKGHPYLKNIILQVIDNIKQYNILRDDSGRKGVIKVTGPIVYTQQIESIKHLYPFREVNIKQDFGIEYSIYQSLDKNKNHHHIFKKHYSKIIRPVVKPEKIADYSVLPFFYLKKYLMKFISFLLTMSKKQHFPT